MRPDLVPGLQPWNTLPRRLLPPESQFSAHATSIFDSRKMFADVLEVAGRVQGTVRTTVLLWGIMISRACFPCAFSQPTSVAASP